MGAKCKKNVAGALKSSLKRACGDDDDKDDDDQDEPKRQTKRPSRSKKSQRKMTPLEAVREEVKFALETQRGQEGPAIDGDGHAIWKLSFFAGKVQNAWLDKIADELFVEHDCPNSGQHWVFDEDGNLMPNPNLDEDGNLMDVVIKGVCALSFHHWVANNVVMKVDPEFHSGAEGRSGRRSQARAIKNALVAWVNAGDA